MKIFNISQNRFIILIAFVISISSCDFNRNEPGWSYFNDMEQSQAYETWSVNPHMPDSQLMVHLPEGTLAMHESAFNFVKTPEDEAQASAIINPHADNYNHKRAKDLYFKLCLTCHGEKGDGKGHLFISKKYPYPPASFLAARAMDKTDGQLFHNIRIGYGVMGANGYMMTPDESWQLVNYIRELQGKR